MEVIMILAGIAGLITGISIGINDVFAGQPEGVYLVGLSCLLATIVLVAGIDDLAYKKGQIDAIEGHIHYEMVIAPPDTFWVEIK